MSTLEELRIAGIRNFGSEADEQQVRIFPFIPNYVVHAVRFFSAENHIFVAINVDRRSKWLWQDHHN